MAFNPRLEALKKMKGDLRKKKMKGILGEMPEEMAEVSVVADDPENLKEGLEKAQDIAEDLPLDEMMEDDSDEYEEEDELLEDSDLEEYPEDDMSGVLGEQRTPDEATGMEAPFSLDDIVDRLSDEEKMELMKKLGM